MCVWGGGGDIFKTNWLGFFFFYLLVTVVLTVLGHAILHFNLFLSCVCACACVWVCLCVCTHVHACIQDIYSSNPLYVPIYQV